MKTNQTNKKQKQKPHPSPISLYGSLQYQNKTTNNKAP
jgi:hypothetical protein